MKAIVVAATRRKKRFLWTFLSVAESTIFATMVLVRRFSGNE